LVCVHSDSKIVLVLIFIVFICLFAVAASFN